MRFHLSSTLQRSKTHTTHLKTEPYRISVDGENTLTSFVYLSHAQMTVVAFSSDASSNENAAKTIGSTYAFCKNGAFQKRIGVDGAYKVNVPIACRYKESFGDSCIRVSPHLLLVFKHISRFPELTSMFDSSYVNTNLPSRPKPPPQT